MEGAAYVNGGDGAGVAWEAGIVMMDVEDRVCRLPSSSPLCLIMGKRWEKCRDRYVDLAWGEQDLRNGEQ
jgi:hypothetical protein